MDYELSIILPAYHEHESIGPVLRAIAAEVACRHEVIVVCDSSDDPTAPVVRQMQREIPHLRLELNEAGGGVGRAIMAGVAASRGAWIVVTMADGSDDPRTIDAMVAEARKGAAVVAASRYVAGGAHHGGPGWKRLLSRTTGLALHHVAGFPVHDVTNNFRLYRRGLLEVLSVDGDRGFVMAIEATVKAFSAGLPMTEVATVWQDRRHGSSQFRFLQWLPHYTRWFVVGLGAGARRRWNAARGVAPSSAPRGGEG